MGMRCLEVAFGKDNISRADTPTWTDTNSQADIFPPGQILSPRPRLLPAQMLPTGQIRIMLGRYYFWVNTPTRTDTTFQADTFPAGQIPFPEQTHSLLGRYHLPSKYIPSWADTISRAELTFVAVRRAGPRSKRISPILQPPPPPPPPPASHLPLYSPLEFDFQSFGFLA